MNLDYALLADSAQVSQGKTFILGGGVSILWRQQFPAPLGFALVCQFSYERAEANSQRHLRIVIIDADGNPILPDIDGDMVLGDTQPGFPRNVQLVVPLVIPFPPLPVLQHDGAYDLQILLDGNHVKTISFAVVNGLPPGLQLPPA